LHEIRMARTTVKLLLIGVLLLAVWITSPASARPYSVPVQRGQFPKSAYPGPASDWYNFYPSDQLRPRVPRLASMDVEA